MLSGLKKYFIGEDPPESRMILQAVANNNIGEVKKLVQKGVSVNFDDGNTTPLLLAIENENVEIVEYLINNGANVNIVHPQGGFPLFLAITRRNSGIALLLIDSGANVNVIGHGGISPLIATVMYQLPDVVESLLQKGVNIDHQDEKGYTSLIQSIYYENKDIFDILLNSGADVNLENNNGTRPLFLAGQVSIDMFNSLLQRGAEPVDLDGLTIQDYAQRGRFLPEVNLQLNPLPQAIPIQVLDKRPEVDVFDIEGGDNLAFDEAYTADNLIFKIGEFYFSYPLEQIQNQLLDKSGFRYRCNVEKQGAPREEEVIINTPYYLLRATGNYLLDLKYINNILTQPASHLYELIETPETIAHTASWNSIIAGYEEEGPVNQRGNPVNIVSSDHCQAGTDRKVYTLKQLSFPGALVDHVVAAPLEGAAAAGGGQGGGKRATSGKLATSGKQATSGKLATSGKQATSGKRATFKKRKTRKNKNKKGKKTRKIRK